MIEKIIDIAQGAGDLLMKYFKGDFEVDFKDKERKDPVTVADLESQEYIVKRLKEEFPGDQIIAEECATGDIDYSGRLWVVDPLDGTRRFVNKEDSFGVSIGLCIRGIPLLGVVYAPARGIVHSAEKGKGAFVRRGGKTERIRVSKVKQISDATLICSDTTNITEFLQEASTSLNVRKRVFEGSSVLRACLIASGKGDILIPPSVNVCKWDTCGVHVILEEAGGMITDINGDPLDYKQDRPNWENAFIATNGLLHDAVLGRIKKLLPKKQNK